MGSGIAQLAAQNGFQTVLYDVGKATITKSKDRIKANLQSLVEKGRIAGSFAENSLAHLNFTSNFNDCVADLVIEAIIENTSEKIALFNQLSEINHSETIFVTNTSSLSVSTIAAGIQNPSRFAGMHFFNPATVMKLVEIVSGDFTNQTVISALSWLSTKLGKTAIYCKDSPGFIVNRVARQFYLESLFLAENNIADIATIDELIQSTGFKMGPFHLMDLIGNDINYAVSESIYGALGKPERLKPSSLQKSMVTQGNLGRKTGKGFFGYNSSDPIT
jgi:3-hydroxybutyryl-CoA dehydrogenase